MTWTAPRTWVAGEVVTASLLNTHVRDNLLELNGTASPWTSYTPVWLAGATNITLNAASAARYKQVGKTVFLQLAIAATGTIGAGSLWNVSLPVTARALQVSRITNLGSSMHTAGGTWVAGYPNVPSAGAGTVFFIWVAALNANVTSAITVGEQITAHLSYEAA